MKVSPVVVGFMHGVLAAAGIVLFGYLFWQPSFSNSSNYPCTRGELVLLDYTEKWIEYVDENGRRSWVLDLVPLYECRLPEKDTKVEQ